MGCCESRTEPRPGAHAHPEGHQTQQDTPQSDPNGGVSPAPPQPASVESDRNAPQQTPSGPKREYDATSPKDNNTHSEPNGDLSAYADPHTSVAVLVPTTCLLSEEEEDPEVKMLATFSDNNNNTAPRTTQMNRSCKTAKSAHTDDTGSMHTPRSDGFGASKVMEEGDERGGSGGGGGGAATEQRSPPPSIPHLALQKAHRVEQTPRSSLHGVQGCSPGWYGVVGSNGAIVRDHVDPLQGSKVCELQTGTHVYVVQIEVCRWVSRVQRLH